MKIYFISNHWHCNNIHLVGTFALRIDKLSVPKSIELECDYDLEGETLYEVKWYKDNQEFFRYTPNDQPVAKVFEMHKFKVNVSESKLFIMFLALNNNSILNCFSEKNLPIKLFR